MATTKKFLDYTGLQYFYNKLKAIFVQKVKDGENYLEIGTEKDASGVTTATTIGFKDGVIVGTTTEAYSGSTGLATQGYVDEKVKGVESTVTSGLNITGVSENGLLAITDKKVGIDSTKIAVASGETIGETTKIVTEKYVDEKINDTVTKAVVYKGTTNSLPTGTPVNGDMWKVTAEVTIAEGLSAKTGDVIIYNGDTSKWEVIPAGDDIEYTGIKVGETYVVSPTAGGDAVFETVDGEELFTIGGAAGKVIFAASKKLRDAVTKIEGLIVDAKTGVTLGDVTYDGGNILGAEGDDATANTIYGVKAYVDDKVGAIDAGITAVTTSETIGAVSVNGTDVKIGGADDLENLIGSGVTAVTVDSAAVTITDNTLAFEKASTYDDTNETEKALWTANGAGKMSIKVGETELEIAQRITDDEIAAICTL